MPRRAAAVAVTAVAVTALAALQLPAAAAGARPAATPSVAPCALGEMPPYLASAVPSALAAEERRFVARLGAMPSDERTRLARAFSTAAAAYVYGMPRVLLGATVERYPRNALVGLGELATPASRTVVAPNNDTLYSVSRVDLRDGPVVLDAPATGGRYSVVQLLDIDTNVVAYVGSRQDRERASTTVIVPPGWQGTPPAGARVVRSPSTLVWLLGRTLVDGPADVGAATGLMRRYALTPLARWNAGERQHLQIVTRRGQPDTAVPKGAAFLAALATRLAESPPPARDACALRSFARVGIGPGLAPPTELAAAVEAGLRAGDRAVDRLVAVERHHVTKRHGGWWLVAGDTGRFGIDYARRALVARIGLGANVPAEALYPVTDRDSGNRPLDGRHRYVVRFAPGQLPPVRAFWSLTLYDRDLFLHANPLDRYAVGDRTGGLRPGRDGSLTIHVSHDEPHGAARANWLPAPDGPFRLYLRLYEPTRAALDGRWAPPTIERLP